MALSAICVLLIFAVMARQIVHPIRVIAKVAEDVRFGNINARFIAKGKTER